MFELVNEFGLAARQVCPCQSSVKISLLPKKKFGRPVQFWLSPSQQQVDLDDLSQFRSSLSESG